MGLVLNLLESKGYDVLTVRPDQMVKDAIKRMEDIAAGTALVTEGDQLVGIISERDVIRKVVLQGKSIDTVPVMEIMSTRLTTVTPETQLDECMQLMTEKRIRHLPVLKDQQLCGIVSIGDVVKYLVVEKDFKIKNLETYISGAM
ncbi:MAG: CBS domain-containing protein [Lentisphaerae bacterium]|jgi:CBS domain-containing protein|nr:CBS domain-containing protein [Lentisphaerota bacterium]